MSVKLCSVDGTVVTVEIKVDISGPMLEAEEAILTSLNEAGSMVTGEALKRFDTDGSKIAIGNSKWFSKGQEPKIYQTPYGEVEVKRHVYQGPRGGQTYCPLERDARIVVTSTPRFAKMVSHKMSNGASTWAHKDLCANHGRTVARSYVQNLADAVGSVAQAKEETWSYETPKLDKLIKTVAVSIDGTCMLMCGGGYREAMTGTISLYDKEGERQHTIYIGATPEYGKATFLERMDREIAHTNKLYPQAIYVGIADGAETNWNYLKRHTTVQILDFYHATEYLADVATAAHPRNQGKRAQWLEDSCHNLKHKHGAAALLLKEMEDLHLQAKRLSTPIREKLDSAITYFRNHQHQMDYQVYRARSMPIGSGVTEAACKTLIKQRLCCSGMKWTERGASIVLSLRALVLTKDRWEQFWEKISQYGFQHA